MKKIPSAKPFSGSSLPYRGPARSLGTLTFGFIAKTLGKRGFAELEIITQWPGIVGESLAEISAPERIVWSRQQKETGENQTGSFRTGSSGTLHIRVDGPAAIEIQHVNKRIIERINSFFGFSAISGLRIIQAPIEQKRFRKKKRSPIPDRREKEPKNKSIEAALERLGSAIRKKMEKK
ncbi:MAG: DciA family protein [Alphaproteobacteria bacterium]|nr:DciA family protein [Alphaproteobacteria bacterium]